MKLKHQRRSALYAEESKKMKMDFVYMDMIIGWK